MATSDKCTDQEKVVGDIEHLDNLDIKKGDDAEWASVCEGAADAEEAERSMTFVQAIRAYPQAAFWSFAISMCIIMEGYDTAVLGNILGLPQFREKFGVFVDDKSGYQLPPAWQMAVNQAPNVGCIIGIFIASEAQHRWGYKRTLQAALVWLIGCIFIVFFAPNVQILFLGELLCGLPWGAFSSSAVSYASEIAPIGLRGYLTTYVNLCWIIGQLLAAGILYRVLQIDGEWAYKTAFAIQWAWPVPLFILITLAPESPWFLVRKGRLVDAEQTVARLGNGGGISPSTRVAMMVRTNQLELDNNVGGSFLDCFKGTDLRRTMISCLTWACQPLCGMAFTGSVVYFLQQAGMETSATFKVNIGVSCMALAGTCLSWITLTYGGRRSFFIGGLVAMSLILWILGAMYWPAEHSTGARWGQAVLMLLFIFVYDFTVGPLTYCIVGETSATRLRAKTVGLARNFYNIVSLTLGILNTYMLNPTAWNMKSRSAFVGAGTATVMAIWAYFCLPEMKRRSYFELDILFERGVPARKFKSTVVEADETS